MYLPVGMAVQPRRRAVSGPSGVSDTGMAIKDLGEIRLGLINQLFELGNLANFLESIDFILLVAVDC